MRSMKDPYLCKQDDCDATALAFHDLGAQLSEQTVDVLPLNVGAGGMSKDQFQNAAVLPLQALDGTTLRY